MPGRKIKPFYLYTQNNADSKNMNGSSLTKGLVSVCASSIRALISSWEICVFSSMKSSCLLLFLRSLGDSAGWQRDTRGVMTNVSNASIVAGWRQTSNTTHLKIRAPLSHCPLFSGFNTRFLLFTGRRGRYGYRHRYWGLFSFFYHRHFHGQTQILLRQQDGLLAWCASDLCPEKS